jgi:hypothetical protein
VINKDVVLLRDEKTNHEDFESIAFKNAQARLEAY